MMMTMEKCNIASMLFMGGLHLVGFLAIAGLMVLLGVMIFRSFSDRPANAS